MGETYAFGVRAFSNSVMCEGFKYLGKSMKLKGTYNGVVQKNNFLKSVK